MPAVRFSQAMTLSVLINSNGVRFSQSLESLKKIWACRKLWLSKNYCALWIKVLVAAEEWCHTRNHIFLISSTKKIWAVDGYLKAPIFALHKNENFWCSGQNPVCILPAFFFLFQRCLLQKLCNLLLEIEMVCHFCAIELIPVSHVCACSANCGH